MKSHQLNTDQLFQAESRTSIRWDLYRLGIGITASIALLAVSLWVSYAAQLGLKPPTSDSAVTSNQITPPSPTPRLTPPIAWSKKSIKLAVLNGSGQAGRGGKVAEQIRQVGYTVNRIDLAAVQSETTLAVSSDIASLSAQIKASLDVVVDNITVKTQPEPGVSTAIIILGSGK